jgi:ABC-type polysaccharide/polyol phosphate export permease
MIEPRTSGSTLSALGEDLAKLGGFIRRDFLVLISYRIGFLSDWFNLLVQVLILYFVGQLIDPSTLPEYGGTQPSYVEFAAVGIAVGSLVQANLARVMAAIRSEQLMGTLEMVFLTPTAPTTVLLGSVVYDLIYVPIRTVIFLVLLTVLLDLGFSFAAVGPLVLVLLAFIPFLWGLSLIGAGSMLTFRRGGGVAGIVGLVLVVASGSYFPISVLPEWLQSFAEKNPVTVAVDGVREALLGTASASDAIGDATTILPYAVVALVVGLVALRLALQRERRRGTLGTY